MDTLTQHQRSKQMALVKSRDTKPEVIVRRLVHALGYRFRLHRRDLPGCPDLVLPRHNKVILVHGCFWHRHHCKLGDRLPKSRLDFWLPKLQANKVRDQNNIARLRQLGWKVLVVWECQTAPSKRDKLKRKLETFLKEQQLELK